MRKLNDNVKQKIKNNFILILIIGILFLFIFSMKTFYKNNYLSITIYPYLNLVMTIVVFIFGIVVIYKELKEKEEVTIFLDMRVHEKKIFLEICKKLDFELQKECNGNNIDKIIRMDSNIRGNIANSIKSEKIFTIIYKETETTFSRVKTVLRNKKGATCVLFDGYYMVIENLNSKPINIKDILDLKININEFYNYNGRVIGIHINKEAFDEIMIMNASYSEYRKIVLEKLSNLKTLIDKLWYH